MNKKLLDPDGGYFMTTAKLRALKNKVKVKKILPINKLGVIADIFGSQKSRTGLKLEGDIIAPMNYEDEDDEATIKIKKRNTPLRICDNAELDQFYAIGFKDLLPITI